jgi:hypothetical protein
MFHPDGHPLERGWVGRVEPDRVVQLAAQTLQSFFLGGGKAREHAEYPLDEVTMLAPVLNPPAVRIFEADANFFFSNPAAILPPGATAVPPRGGASVEALVRPCAVVGADGAVGGFTILGELRAGTLEPPKDRDFALYLGPVVVTPDEHAPAGFDWQAAVALAGENTSLRAGDLVAGPVVGRFSALERGASFALSLERLGTLHGSIAK